MYEAIGNLCIRLLFSIYTLCKLKIAPKKSAQQDAIEEDISDESANIVSEDLGFLFTFVAAEKKYEKKRRQKSKSLAVVKSSSMPIPHFLQIL